MYELKKIGENWLLRRIGGRFVRLSILKDATNVQIQDNCVIADDIIYEIIENNKEILIVEVPDVSTKFDRTQSAVPRLRNQNQRRHSNSYENQTVKCLSLNEEKDLKTMTRNISYETEVPEVTTKFDRSQSEAPQLKQQKPKRHCYENHAVECSSLNEETYEQSLTHPLGDVAEPDFKETKTKLEMFNKSSPKQNASIYLGSDELAEDLKSLTTGSAESIEYKKSLEAGPDMVAENEEIDTETTVFTSKNFVSERYDDAYYMNEQQKAVEGDASLTSDHTFVVDVIPSDIAKACGLTGTVICSIENEAILFRNSITDEGIYSFPYPWIRRYAKNWEMFNFEVGRKCPHGPGTIELCTKHARKIHSLVTKIIQSKKVAQVIYPDCKQQL